MDGIELFFVLLGVFFFIGTPVMLIIALMRLGRLRDELKALRRLLTPPAVEATEPESVVETVPTVMSEPVAEAAPIVTVASPTALEVFFAKIGDWLLVRGAFAPPGMTREFAFATRWLVRVGTVLIVASLAYFAKLSIDRGWMGPTGRVVMTLLWGSIGVAAGAALVKRTAYGVIGHALAALGIVALYFGFGLGHRFFDPPVIASPSVAFASLAGVTIAAGLMAVFLSSPTIAVLGLVGGYLVPVIAGRDSGFPLGLDVYLLMLNLGAFVVARVRRWSALDFLASFLAYVVCFVWCQTHPSCGRVAIFVSFIFLTLVHALYMTSVVLGSRFRNRAGNAIAWAGLALSACGYLTWLAIYLRRSISNEVTGLVFLGFVAVYLTVATFSIRRHWADRQTVNILLVFALAFLTLAPLLLFDFVWCVVCWSVIAVAASEAEVRTGEKILGILSLVILACAAFVGLFSLAPEAYNWTSAATVWKTDCVPDYYSWGSEFVRRLVCLWTLPLAMLLVARRARSWLFIWTAAIGFIFFTAEAAVFGRTFLPTLKTGTVTVAWTLLAFVIMTLGIRCRVRAARLTALVLLAVSVAKLGLIDTAGLPTPARVSVFALVGILLMVGAFLYVRAKERFEQHD